MARAVATNFYTAKELTFQDGLGTGSAALMEPQTTRRNTRRYTALCESLGRAHVPGYNRLMRGGILIRLALVLLTVGLAASASDEPTTAPLLPCPEGSPEAVSCNPSKKELK